jgi:hypothetical protein
MSAARRLNFDAHAAAANAHLLFTPQDDKAAYVMEVDDETDEDCLAVLLDKQPPLGVTFVSSVNVPGAAATLANAQASVASILCGACGRQSPPLRRVLA